MYKRGYMSDSVFDVSEISEFSAALLELANKKMPTENKKFIRKEQSVLRKMVRAEARTLKKKTGKFKANIDRSRVFNTEEDTVGTVFIRGGKKGAPHAHLLEDGHRIVGHRPNLTDTGKRTRAFKVMEKASESFKGKYMKDCEDFLDFLIKEKGL